MRRNLFFVWAMAALMFTVVSCKKDKDPFLKAEYTGTSVSATGGTATFIIESNVDWTVANTDAWITSIEPKTGNGNNTITVTFAANTTTQERSSVFTITSEAPTKSVTIMQAAADAPAGSLTVEYIPADIPAAGGTATFKVTSNVAWTATCPDSWVSMNPAQGTGNADVTVTIGANADPNTRLATITVGGEGVNDANVLISQLGAIDDSPLLFTDIQAGTFVANGVPSFLSNPGPSTWNGTLSPQSDESGTYYTIAKFANILNVYVDYYEGELYIDNVSKLGSGVENPNLGVYFDAVFEDSEYVYTLTSYSPSYNKLTKTLDFTGKYEGYDILVGLGGHTAGPKTALEGVFSDFYANLKLVITPSSGTPEIEKSNSVSLSGKAVSLENLKYGGVVEFDPAKFSRK